MRVRDAHAKSGLYGELGQLRFVDVEKHTQDVKMVSVLFLGYHVHVVEEVSVT